MDGKMDARMGDWVVVSLAGMFIGCLFVCLFDTLRILTHFTVLVSKSIITLTPMLTFTSVCNIEDSLARASASFLVVSHGVPGDMAFIFSTTK